MSSVSSPLGTFFPQAFSPPAADQSARTQRLQSAAQPTPAPVDTVTISGYVPQPRQPNQQTKQPQQLTTPAAPTANNTADVPAQSGGTSAGQAPAARSPAAGPATPAAGSGFDGAQPPVQNIPNFVGSLPATQQQAIVQLDQILEQLGIDPDTIPISEQLSMVLDLDNPSALVQLVQSLGQVVQSPPANAGNAATKQVQTVVQPSPTPPAGALATTNAASPAAAENYGFASQFQELQQSLEAIGANSFTGSAAQPQASFAAAAGIGVQGQALNIVV